MIHGHQYKNNDMITKRINTDLFLNLLFKDKLTNQNINYSGANGINLELKKQGNDSTQWINQGFTLTDDGILHFQWNADENVILGIYDARISFYKISSASENGKIQYKYDAISLFQIVQTSDEETGVDGIGSIQVVYYGGADGLSAYELAVKQGYTGTLEEFSNIIPDSASAEQIREDNEQKGIDAETIRQQQYTTMKEWFDSVKDNLVYHN